VEHRQYYWIGVGCPGPTRQGPEGVLGCQFCSPVWVNIKSFWLNNSNQNIYFFAERSPLRPRQSTSTKSSQPTLMLIWIWEHLSSTAPPCSVTMAGWLVIRCLSTPPSPSCLKTTSPWHTNARTLPCTPACKHRPWNILTADI
jgi:hypothetical protein